MKHAIALLVFMLSVFAVPLRSQNVIGPAWPIGSFSGYGYPNTIDAGDLDNDGDLDLIVSHTSSINYLLNDGCGTFSSKTIVDSIGVDDIEIADLDGDGLLDIVYITNTLNWYRNTGSGFNASQQIDAGTEWPVRCIATDLDDDGDQDIVLSARFGRLYQFTNSGVSIGDSVIFLPSIFIDSIGDRVNGLVFDDLNGDDLEELIGSTTYGERFVCPNLAGTIGPASIVDDWDSFTDINTGDLDGDGLPDLILTGSIGLSWKKNIGGLLFAPRQTIGSAGERFPLLVDFDNDGDNDIAVGSWFDPYTVSGCNGWVMYENLGGGLSWNSFKISDDLVFESVVGDFTGNGFPDIIGGIQFGKMARTHLPCTTELISEEIDSVCLGDSISLALDAGVLGKVLWFPNDTSATYEFAPTASTLVHVLVQNGSEVCYDSISIVVDPLPTFTSCPNNATLLSTSGGVKVIYGQPLFQNPCFTFTPYTSLMAGLPSGSIFPPGTTAVDIGLDGAFGITDTCSFSITVIEDDPTTSTLRDQNVLRDHNYIEVYNLSGQRLFCGPGNGFNAGNLGLATGEMVIWRIVQEDLSIRTGRMVIR